MDFYNYEHSFVTAVTSQYNIAERYTVKIGVLVCKIMTFILSVWHA
jgi:hypothetical protein